MPTSTTFTASHLASGQIITGTADSFAVEDGARTLIVRLDEIERVEIYKRDELTADLVCFDIVLANGDRLTLHEGIPGFDSMVEALARLAGLAIGWRDTVILPPFAPNPLVAYVRPAPAEIL
jgi:hypothetical protein